MLFFENYYRVKIFTFWKYFRNASKTDFEHSLTLKKYLQWQKKSIHTETSCTSNFLLLLLRYCHKITVNQCYWVKIEKRFLVYEFCLGIDFSFFRLGHFGKVEPQLGSHGTGVEIDTGWKRKLIYILCNKAECCRTNTFRVMNFLIFFYFRMQMEPWSKFEKQA